MDTHAKIKELLEEAEVVLIGAGAGLSTAAGMEYGGECFLSNFPRMHKEYGYTDMYSAGFHRFSSSEEKWGYWSKFIYLQRYKDGAKPLYRKLLKALENKDYFVLTTNVDHQLLLAGFDKKRVFFTQGDYGLFQCSKPCHQKTYDNEMAIKEMVLQEKDGSIPSVLIPKCPICGEEMDTNLRCDERFVEDEGWHDAASRYNKFISNALGKKVLLLELGVGWNTPGIIKYPFLRFAIKNPKSFYISINKGENYLPKELQGRGVCLNEDIAEVVNSLI